MMTRDPDAEPTPLNIGLEKVATQVQDVRDRIVADPTGYQPPWIEDGFWPGAWRDEAAALRWVLSLIQEARP